jgi:cell division septation protein DedD
MDDFFAAMRLSALLDGDLEGSEKDVVERAIHESPKLRVAYSRMMTAVELVRSQGNLAPPEDLEQRILDRLRSDGAMGTAWADRAPSRRVLVAVAALLGGLGLVWAQWPAPSPVSDAPLPEEASPSTAVTPETTTPSPTAVPKEELLRERSAARDDAMNRARDRAHAKEIKRPRPGRPVPTPGYVAAAPTTPVPKWEDAMEEASASLVEPMDRAPERTTLRLYPSKPDALYVLDGWVAHTRGEMKIGSRGLRVFSSEDNFARLQITLPGAGLATFMDQLHGLGAVHQVVPPPPSAASEQTVSLDMEIQYQP